MKKEINIAGVLKDSLKNLFHNKDMHLRFAVTQRIFNLEENLNKNIIINDLTVRPSDFTIYEINITIRQEILVSMDDSNFISKKIILDFIKDFNSIYEERKEAMEDKIKEDELKKEIALNLNKKLEEINSSDIFREKVKE